MTEPAEILDCSTCNGTLVFDTYDGIPEIDLQNGFAWCATDLSDLWKMQVRGEDRTLHGMPGVLAYQRVLDKAVMQFPMVVVGKYDRLGMLNVDADAGLAENLGFLQFNLERPFDFGNGTRPVTWVREDGTTWAADVHVIPPSEQKIVAGAMCKMVLTIEVKDGIFTETGS